MPRKVPKVYEEQHPEKLSRITETFLGDREGEEERGRAALEVENERDSPMGDEMGATQDEARSSGENGINDDIEMEVFLTLSMQTRIL